MEFSSNLSAIYMKSCALTFPPIFGLFEIFNCNFAKLSNNNQNYQVHLKGQSTVEKGCKHHQNLPINSDSNYVTVERTARRLLSVTGKKTYKHHVFAPTAGERCTIFPKLCIVIEIVKTIKEGAIHFSIQHIVFRTGYTEKFGLIDRRAVSQQ